MKTKIVIGLLTVAAILAWTEVAGAQTTPGEPDKIKALLVRPAGWKAEWNSFGGYNKGESEFKFEVRGQKLVVKIMNFTYPATCERDVTITADVVKFDGCYDRAVALRFDPNDQDYPFKGNSAQKYELRLRAK